MAYSPLGEGTLLNDKALKKIAERHSSTPAQIALAWTLRIYDIISIPKSGSIVHVEDNYKSLAIELSSEDIRDLDRAYPAPKKKITL